MKKFLLSAMTALISIVLLAGCPDPGVTITDNSAVLVNSVWAGETPRLGDWLTITFRAEGRATLSFSIDNTSNDWEFTFNTANAGTITNPDGDWTPAPNGFTINGDTLTIVNYGFHGGAPRDFRRLRQADLTVDPVPFTSGVLAENLVGSVWAGSTPAAENTGWITISFRPKATIGTAEITEENHNENVAVISYAHDSTTAVWNYTYNNTERTGGPFTFGHINGIDGAPPTTTSWQPGTFTISEDEQSLTVAVHGGLILRRYR